jgi:hypothetical protein
MLPELLTGLFQMRNAADPPESWFTAMSARVVRDDGECLVCLSMRGKRKASGVGLRRCGDTAHHIRDVAVAFFSNIRCLGLFEITHIEKCVTTPTQAQSPLIKQNRKRKDAHHTHRKSSLRSPLQACQCRSIYPGRLSGLQVRQNR